MKYLTGKFIACYGLTISATPYISYVNSLGSAWTQVAVSETNTSRYVSDILFVEGTYVASAGVVNNVTGAVYYSSNLNGPWAVTSVPTNSGGGLSNLNYKNGFFIAAEQRHTNSTSVAIYYSTLVTGPFIKVTLETLSSGINSNGVMYCDETVFMLCKRSYGVSIIYKGTLPEMPLERTYAYIKAALGGAET